MAIESAPRAWSGKPLLGWIVRAVLFLLPLVASWIAVRIAVSIFSRPDGFLRTLLWIAAVLALSVIVYVIFRRVLQRFSPLGVLFSISLTFPDVPPSRWRAAMLATRASILGADTSLKSARGRKAERLVELVASVNRHEPATWGHGDRVRSYAEVIGKQLGLPDDDMEKLRWAALLHDVGKLDVPKWALKTDGEPSDEALAQIRMHPVHAQKLLAPYADWLGDWARTASDHHERWDGTGYPNGLSGQNISRGGRIVAVADAYDAMTSPRSYRRPISAAEAREELVRSAGTQFDPAVVRAFIEAGIRRGAIGLGPTAAVAELPARLLAFGSSAATTAATAGAVVVTTAIAPPMIADAISNTPSVERVVDIQETTTTTSTTTSTTSTTTSTTTLAPPTTRRAVATTTIPTTTTVPPTTAPPPPPTTTAAPTTTTTAPPPPTTTYPQTPTTFAPLPTYPET